MAWPRGLGSCPGTNCPRRASWPERWLCSWRADCLRPPPPTPAVAFTASGSSLRRTTPGPGDFRPRRRPPRNHHQPPGNSPNLAQGLIVRENHCPLRCRQPCLRSPEIPGPGCSFPFLPRGRRGRTPGWPTVPAAPSVAPPGSFTPPAPTPADSFRGAAVTLCGTRSPGGCRSRRKVSYPVNPLTTGGRAGRLDPANRRSAGGSDRRYILFPVISFVR
jgi:hypothetical protein